MSRALAPTYSACLIAAFTSMSFGQDRPLKPILVDGPAPSVRLSTVMNAKVLIQDDQAAGQVIDIVMSPSGCIDYLVASHDEQYYVIPYSAVAFRGRNRAIFVDITPTQFRGVSFFTGTEWPDFYATNYQKNVLKIFGVNSIRNDRPQTLLKPNLEGEPILQRDSGRPDVGVRESTPTDRIKGDSAPVSRDKNAPITKPNVNPPPKVGTPKVDVPKGDKPIADPLKPKTSSDAAIPK